MKRKTPQYKKAFTKTCPSCLLIFQCVRSTAFNLQDPTDFAKACHYSNLQPMWQTENCAKGNRHET